VVPLEVVDQAADQRVAALLHHREQAHLLLEHVNLEGVRHRREVFGQFGGGHSPFARERHEHLQLAPMRLVESFDDVRDQLGHVGARRGLVIRHGGDPIPGRRSAS
jgi:hypothetical protein